MNSSPLLYILLFLLVSPLLSCGVKSDPVAPADTFLPSVESYYMDKPPVKNENVLNEANEQQEQEQEDKEKEAKAN